MHQAQALARRQRLADIHFQLYINVFSARSGEKVFTVTLEAFGLNNDLKFVFFSPEIFLNTNNKMKKSVKMYISADYGLRSKCGPCSSSIRPNLTKNDIRCLKKMK